MPRVTNSVATRTRRKKVLKAAKGARSTRSKLFKTANETVNKGQAYAYRDRKVRKRTFRQLWIARISAAARLNGLTYSTFMHGIRTAGIEIDRKVLADIAMNDAATFTQIVDQVKAAQAAS